MCVNKFLPTFWDFLLFRPSFRSVGFPPKMLEICFATDCTWPKVLSLIQRVGRNGHRPYIHARWLVQSRLLDGNVTLAVSLVPFRHRNNGNTRVFRMSPYAGEGKNECRFLECVQFIVERRALSLARMYVRRAKVRLAQGFSQGK